MPAPLVALGISVLSFFSLAIILMAAYLVSGHKRLLDIMVLSFISAVMMLVVYLVYGYKIGVIGE